MLVTEAIERLEKAETLFLENKYVFDFMREMEKIKGSVKLLFQVNAKIKGVTNITLDK